MKLNWIKKADNDDDNVALISSAWCRNKAGICLSFAISIGVMEITELQQFGEEFQKAVTESYGSLLNKYFYPKSESPLVFANDGGDLVMIWSFQGDDDADIEKAMKYNEIMKISY